MALKNLSFASLRRSKYVFTSIHGRKKRQRCFYSKKIVLIKSVNFCETMGHCGRISEKHCFCRTSSPIDLLHLLRRSLMLSTIFILIFLFWATRVAEALDNVYLLPSVYVNSLLCIVSRRSLGTHPRLAPLLLLSL